MKAAAATAASLVAVPIALDLAWISGRSVARPVVAAQTLAVPAHALGAAAAGLAALTLPGSWRGNWCRRSLLAASSLTALVGAGLLIGDRGGGARPGDATLTVYSANLEFLRGDISANVAEMLDADADVAVFQEVTPDYLAQLRDGLAGRYSEVLSTSRDDALGAAMFARVEVRNATMYTVAGSPTPSADIVAADGTVVRVMGVHTTPPFLGLTPWQAQHDELAAMANRADRVVIAGDFNAIGRLQPMRHLVANGQLRDAHREVGEGLGLTWPDRLPLARLDRVLFRGLGPVSLRVGGAAGSDHRSLTARFITSSPAGDRRRVSAVVE